MLIRFVILETIVAAAWKVNSVYSGSRKLNDYWKSSGHWCFSVNTTASGIENGEEKMDLKVSEDVKLPGLSFD